MILQALTAYYETLLKNKEKTKVVGIGRSHVKVGYALDLADNGRLKGIISLKQETVAGKKTVFLPSPREVPQLLTRTSGVAANFLCDNSKYLLGIDANGSGSRIKDCFLAAKEKHLTILDGVHTRTAEAVKAFFKNWDPDRARENQALKEQWEGVTDGSNLIFMVDGLEAQDDPEVMQAWDEELERRTGDSIGTCLVTGEKTEIARIHTMLKGVQGAQSSGAALVSFNAPAFESYGKEQSFNAPVGAYAEFAYTTALNYLLSKRENKLQVADTTVIFWAEDGESAYQQAFSWSLDPAPDQEETVRGILQNTVKGEMINFEGIRLDPKRHFYILGLAPNAARISVRFFYQDEFGNILDHVKAHYERLRLIRPSYEKREYLGIYSLLQQTVNQKSRDKKAIPNMAAAVLRAILSGSRYPASLYTDTLIRIRAEQGEISWGRASIIKAYLIKNYNWKEGETFVKLNENEMNEAYLLGRVFAVLEAVQEKANPGINATIKDRYFNSACMTPGVVFPILLRLKNSHIRKISDEGSRIFFEKQLTELLGKLDTFPHRLTLEEQGKFMLGYYHQVQKRFTKKEEQ